MKIRVSKYVAEKMHRTKDQIILQTYKDSGKGGQHRNKTETGVRLIDTITGIRAECCDERKQSSNRKIAKEKLVERLQAFYELEEKKLRLKENFVDLSRTIRTYDEKHGVTDHRVPGRLYNLERVLEGKDLGKIIKDLAEVEVRERLP